ncbi:sirohydrochlorin cobaltochelatase [Mollicutes bacterium LVI A0078]|nr:sirohydrochlorin cobaltochelatase [Mollicutes bacterium LVI A0075]WOO91558.1 sirohydrochlorin cobaltochelatase [Mollicutes bacterium LVI A0078]
MIICLYHGSSFKEVNESQTKVMTDYIKSSFPDHSVTEAYYSKHVLETMVRRGTPLVSFEQCLASNYNNEHIYVLITNMMDGEEYKRILDTIAKVDTDNKVKSTKYLLDKSNIYNLAEAIIEKDITTLHIGHGNTINNSDYQMLNDILSESNNYVTTLKSDIDSVISENLYSKKVLIKPLMITSAYHAKHDIEVIIKNKCEQLGYTPTLDLTPLATNKKILQMCVSNLSELINN